MAKCLVLGGGGFIGSHVSEKLLYLGNSVRIFDKENLDKRNIMGIINKVEFIGGDFTDKEAIKQAVKGVEYIYHFISTTVPATGNINPIYDIETNVIGTINLLEIVYKEGIKRIVFSSSGGTIYGPSKYLPIDEDHPTEPLCSYGISKLTIEKYIRLYAKLHNINYTIIRTSNPYGLRQDPDGLIGAVSVFLNAAITKKTITIWGDGSVIRDYIYIDDVADAFIKAIEAENKNRIYNIGTSVGTNLLELIKTIERTLNIKTQYKLEPSRKVDVPANVLNTDRAHKELGWKAEVSLEEGIKKLAEHYGI